MTFNNSEMLKLMKVRKQYIYIYIYIYMLKRTKMKTKFIVVIEFSLLYCIMSVVSYSVSQECKAFNFRVTDLIRVDVKGMGGKKMCQLQRAV